MKSTNLINLDNIKITSQNCDDIIAISLNLSNKAMLFRARSRQIKRGLAFKRELEKKLEANQ